eukprot:3659656-Lingulodinium_polyedra.AAC.1
MHQAAAAATAAAPRAQHGLVAARKATGMAAGGRLQGGSSAARWAPHALRANAWRGLSRLRP